MTPSNPPRLLVCLGVSRGGLVGKLRVAARGYVAEAPRLFDFFCLE